MGARTSARGLATRSKPLSRRPYPYPLPPPAGAKKGYAVKWNDEPTPIARFFAAAPMGGVATGSNLAPTAALEARATVTMEKERSRLARDLGLLSVAAL